MPETELDLGKMLDICCTAEMFQAQIKALGDLNSASIHVLLLQSNYDIITDFLEESMILNTRLALRWARVQQVRKG